MTLDLQTTQLSEKRILLVGGGGFIGHHLASRLRVHGAEVAVLDSFQVNNLLSMLDTQNAPKEHILYSLMIEQRLEILRKSGVQIFIEDARDYHRLSKRFTDFEPNVVVVLAAVSHASRANKDPMNTLDHSFRSLENALDNSRGRVDQFIFLSSSMVYGNFPADIIDETADCHPIGIYGAVKLGNEKLIAAYGHVFDLPYTIIRPSALYGARCVSRRVGQIFVENAIRGKDLIIQGDGEDRIDFTFIDDFTQGILKSLLTEKAKGEIFNLTYGSARSLNDVADIVTSSFPGIKVKRIARDSLVPERGTLDVSKARELLGYSPDFPIDRGMSEYIDWYKELFKSVSMDSLGSLASQANE